MTILYVALKDISLPRRGYSAPADSGLLMMVRAANTALVLSSFYASQKGLAAFLNVDLLEEALNRKSGLKCEMMGIEESERPKIRDLVNNLTDASINADPEKSMQVWFNYMELFKMGRDMIEERRKNPTDDLMSVVFLYVSMSYD